MSRSTRHLDEYRTAKKSGSIERVERFLAEWEGDELTIAAVEAGTGLCGRTLRRAHVLPLIEAKAGRSFSDGPKGEDPRTVRMLKRKLDEALARIGRLEDRLADRNRTIALRDGRIAELQALIDILSMEARRLVEVDPAPSKPRAAAGTPSKRKAHGGAR